MLTWAGSKEKLAAWILDTAMPGRLPSLVVEPYCGTCKVSMEASRRGCRSALVNDMARGLVDVLRTVAHGDLEVFLAEVRRLDRQWKLADRPDRRRLHTGWRDRYNANTASAAEVFCLFRSSYSGLYRESRAGKFNVPCRTTARYDGPRSLLHEHEVREFAALAREWMITREDGLKVLPQSPPDLRGLVFVLIDPPYEGTFTGYVGGKAPSPVQLEELALRWRDAGATVALCQPGHQREIWDHASSTGRVYVNTRPEAFARRFDEPRDAEELLIVWRPA